MSRRVSLKHRAEHALVRLALALDRVLGPRRMEALAAGLPRPVASRAGGNGALTYG